MRLIYRKSMAEPFLVLFHGLNRVVDELVWLLLEWIYFSLLSRNSIVDLWLLNIVVALLLIVLIPAVLCLVVVNLSFANLCFLLDLLPSLVFFILELLNRLFQDISFVQVVFDLRYPVVLVHRVENVNPSVDDILLLHSHLHHLEVWVCLWRALRPC